jgi:hypothetical protein
MRDLAATGNAGWKMWTIEHKKQEPNGSNDDPNRQNGKTIFSWHG